MQAADCRNLAGATVVGLVLLLLVQASMPAESITSVGTVLPTLRSSAAPGSFEGRISRSASDPSPFPSGGRTGTEAEATGGSQFSWSTAKSPPVGNLTGSGLASDPGQAEAVLFGGSNSSGPLNTTWVYWESNNSWSVIPSATAPTPRSDFGFAADPNAGEAVLFGGLTNDGTDRVVADTWVFNFTFGAWRNVTSATAPPARQDPAFAVAPSLGEALLYGGWNRNYSGTGVLIYSDVWLLNLTTDAWSSAPVVGGPHPPPLEGAALTWDPTLGEFELFGGCFPCVSTVWLYSPTTNLWSQASVTGTSPTPRGSAAWSYDPAQQVDVLFGGLGNAGPLNDTYAWSPDTGAWTAQTLAVHPPGLSGLTATWMDVSSNETLLLAEGAGTSPGVDLWRLAPLASVTVLVLNDSDGLPVEKATVTLDGANPGFTTAFGYRNFTEVTPVDHYFTAIAPGYAPTNRTIWVDPGIETNLVLNLTPIPPAELTVQVVDSNGDGIGRATVGVLINGVQFLTPPLLTNAAGFVNYSGIPTFPAVVTATAVYYHGNSQTADLIAGGHTYVQLQLTPFPVALVHVLGYLPPLGFSWPLFDAQVTVDPRSMGYTDITGNLSLQLDVDGGVTFNGSAPGFFSTQATELAPYTGTFQVNLTLTSLPFGALDVHVLDARTHTPISSAGVNLSVVSGLPLTGLILTSRSSATGYSNDSYPPTGYSVTVEHAGYITNDSLVDLTVAPAAVEPITVNLTPLPASLNPSGNGSFYLFPPGQPIAWVFLLVPLLLLLAGATYLAWTRGDRPPPRYSSHRRPPARPPPGPDPRLFPPPPPGE